MGKVELTVLCNLILVVTAHFFCHILFVRHKSLGTAHTQGELYGVLWRNGTSRIWNRIYNKKHDRLNTHTCAHTRRDLEALEELGHMFMEADKCHHLLSIAGDLVV